MSDEDVTVGRVVVLGSANEDLVFTVERMPLAGETLIASAFERGLGGKGANQAAAAARAGAATVFAGAVGGDPAADAVISNLEARGVDTRRVRRSPESATGRAAIVVDAAGSNQIVVAPGANHEVDARAVDELAAGLTARDVVVMQCEIAAVTVDYAARVFSRTGARVILNLAPFTALSALALGALSVLVVNESEARELVGEASRPAGGPDLARAAAKAAGTACVVTLGEAGSAYSDGADELIVVAAEHVSDVVDTTGAGDCYVGTFAAALARGRTIRVAMTEASAAAADSVRSSGAQAQLELTGDEPVS